MIVIAETSLAHYKRGYIFVPVLNQNIECPTF